MAYTADLPRRATSHASATASLSVGLPLTGTRMRLARITAPHFLALCCAWVKHSDAQPPGSPQQGHDAQAVHDSSIHSRLDSRLQGQPTGDQVSLCAVSPELSTARPKTARQKEI